MRSVTEDKNKCDPQTQETDDNFVESSEENKTKDKLHAPC